MGFDTCNYLKMKSQSFTSVYVALAIKLVISLAKVNDEMYVFFLSASSFVRAIEEVNADDDEEDDDDDDEDDDADDADNVDDDDKEDLFLFANPDIFMIFHIN